MKGRNSIAELKKGIQVVYEDNQKYLSTELNYILQDKTVNEIDDYDIKLIKYLSIGTTQENMESAFKETGITANSKSTIENESTN